MKRSIANTYICIDAEGQTFPIIARTQQLKGVFKKGDIKMFIILFLVLAALTSCVLPDWFGCSVGFSPPSCSRGSWCWSFGSLS